VLGPDQLRWDEETACARSETEIEWVDLEDPFFSSIPPAPQGGQRVLSMFITICGIPHHGKVILDLKDDMFSGRLQIQVGLPGLFMVPLHLALWCGDVCEGGRLNWRGGFVPSNPIGIGLVYSSYGLQEVNGKRGRNHQKT